MAGTVPARSEKNPLRIVQAIRELFEGRSNAVGEVTLTASDTTTTVTAANCGNGSKPQLTPKTANAAAALSTTYVSAVGQGTFTISHDNNSQTDRTFYWSALG